MLYEDSEGDIEILSPTPTYTAIVFLGCKARGEYFFRKNISQFFFFKPPVFGLKRSMNKSWIRDRSAIVNF